MDSQIVRIFDTTLRDGEQSPGASMQKEEKLLVARQLARLGVDVIEAGFPVASPDDFSAVSAISKDIQDGPIICALARAVDRDITVAAEALSGASRGRIHTFIATSPLHMEKKLKMSEDQVLKSIFKSVSMARGYGYEVEFSAEDATRSEPDFLIRAVTCAIEAGAGIINLPDTVGYAVPSQISEMFRNLISRVPGAGNVIFSCHCHDDLGLSVANSLAAVEAGARQVECTINGIGERAGNAALEEIVMALKVRKPYFGVETAIRTEEFTKTSRLVSTVTGMMVQPNKAIVGENAFAHESGIHQDGYLKDKKTYEIMGREQVGASAGGLILGKHSGRHALKDRLLTMGYSFGEEELNDLYDRFKKLADQKKEIFEEDIETLIVATGRKTSFRFILKRLHLSGGTEIPPTATIVLDVDGQEHRMAGLGDGPVDAIYRTLAKMTKTTPRLVSYVVKAITGGTDAQGEVTVRLEEEGVLAVGRGSDTDILVASAKAYLSALNRLDRKKSQEHKADGEVSRPVL
ncbi:2-isopropylmalate synthase [Leptospirillum ferrooxidans]|jgi:2-isopropylmalate synthase|uniref:2-isopropylmalate synthase n=1 Tax=Leptospirillum ferrooxidans (strain C2-3) TaxID=1162668 RepID=I0IS98_LEPFC|nr:2-isopropylmalate synthase [Leptospirillum ferrooxidans]MDA8149625.1 2-isopropylmalate synthase [Nitrospiraceae bacterium]BAM08147.1 2-isopropylmalate synthase [Leptospirillum ferrooxidans C2-3]